MGIKIIVNPNKMTTNRFWSENPNNKRDQIMQHSLPQLLFRQCNANCLDTDMFSAEHEAELLCMQNCQDKTYAAFNLYMQLKIRQEQIRTDYDIKSYAGLEVEQSAATIDNFPGRHPTKVPTAGVEMFRNKSDKNHASIREDALTNK